jgi:hypothetical protein
MMHRFARFAFEARRFYMARTRREQILALLLVAVGVGIWGSSMANRWQAQQQRSTVVAAQLKEHRQWVDNRGVINDDYEMLLAGLSEAELPDRTQVLGQIEALVRQYGFSFRLDPPQTQRRDPLSFHTLSLSIDRAEIGPLMQFTAELRQRLPYVSLDQMTLASDRRNPLQLDARLRLVAIEFRR